MAARELNPFDLNLSRAYSAPEAFCPRSDLKELLQRACAGRLWTLIDGERRMGKSSAVIADSILSNRPLLHVDLMGVGSEPEVTERFRWAWQFFVQQAVGGFWKGISPELSATIPGTGVGVMIGGSTARVDPSSWGDVLVAFDKQVAKTGGLLFIDEMQDLGRFRDKGLKISKSLRAALQMARHVTPVFAGSVQHLLAPFFATSAAAFFKSIRLQYHLQAFEPEAFGSWASGIFSRQERVLESASLRRLFELTGGVTEDVVAICAEVWVQNASGRTISPADVEVAWRSVVANAAQYFLPRIATLTGLQSSLLRYVARNPHSRPFAAETLSAIGAKSGPAHRALHKLVGLELLREDDRDGRKRVSIPDARLAFYLRA